MINIKKIFTLSVLNIYCQIVVCQRFAYNYHDGFPIYNENKYSSVFEAIQNIYLSNEKPSYLTFLPKFVSVDRRFPIYEFAGKNGFLFDAQINQNFTLLRGRDGSSFFRRLSSLSFYFGYHLRMTRDSSKPLLPANQLFGLEYRLSLWNNKTKWIFNRPNYSDMDKDVALKLEEWGDHEDKDNLKVFYLSLIGSHYSNGQPPGFYKVASIYQHDYLNGDFSTNFFRIMFYYNDFIYYHKLKNKETTPSPEKIDPIRQLITFGIGYQRDLSFSKTLSFSPEQRNSYGKDRIISLFKWEINNFYIWRFCYKPKGPLYSERMVKLKDYLSISLRIEPTFILGNLSRYYDSDLYMANKLKSKYRFSIDSYLEITALRLRTLGFIIHNYWGRDYLNIRYDDIISTTQFGLTFKFTKKLPLKFQSYEAAN